MDWIDRMERKKKLRKMAATMLWADFRDMFYNWRMVLFLMVYVFYFLFALIKKMEAFNAGASFCFMIWFLMTVYSMTENVFNYLPVSSKDLIYYLTHRTNLLLAWIFIGYLITALALKGFGVELFVERGIVSMVMLWTSLEWIHQTSLFENSLGKGKVFTDALTTGQKVRYCLYFAYSMLLIMVSMMYGMFMEDIEFARIMAPVLLGASLVQFVFRFDLERWFSFDQYRQRTRRSWYSTPAQLTAEQKS